MLSRRDAMVTAGLALAGGLTRAADDAAASTATQSLRVLVGYTPGGTTDLIARLIADGLRGRYAVVTVENKAGAGGRIALAAARQGERDGTLLVVTPSFPLTMFPHIYKKLPYDPVKDFVPVAGCANSDIALCVGPAVPAEVRSLKELLDWVRADPKRGFYGSPSAGSQPHFAGLMLSKATGVPLSVVNYKGGSQVVQDLLGGQVPSSINPVGELLPYLSDGKLRVVVTFGPQRSRFLPRTPTCVEAGFDVVVRTSIGAFVPAGTPAADVRRLTLGVTAALGTPAVEDGLARLGVEPDRIAGAPFADQVRSELAGWGPVIKASGFTAED